MNWGEIDNIIRSIIAASKTKEEVYKGLVERFNWNENQCKAAADPILGRENPEMLKVKSKVKSVKKVKR